MNWMAGIDWLAISPKCQIYEEKFIDDSYVVDSEELSISLEDVHFQPDSSQIGFFKKFYIWTVLTCCLAIKHRPYPHLLIWKCCVSWTI